MNPHHHRKAVVVDCDCGGAPHTLCCLDHLACADEQFLKIMKANDNLSRAFRTITKNDNTPFSKLHLNDADQVSVLFVECAILNRAHFACKQKCVFKNHFHSFRESEGAPSKDAVQKHLDIDLECVSKLLRRLDSDDATSAKKEVAFWLNAKVLDDFVNEDDDIVNDDDSLAVFARPLGAPNHPNDDVADDESVALMALVSDEE